MSDQTVRYQRTRLQGLDRPPEHLGGGGEGSEERQFLVMRPPGVEADRGSGCAAAKKSPAAAAPYRTHGLPPALRLARGVDGDVRAATAGGAADVLDDIARGRRVQPTSETQSFQAIEPPARFADHDDPRLAQRREHPEQTAQRTVAEHDHRLPGLDPRPLDRQEGAREGFGKGGALGRQRRRQRDDIARDETRWQDDELAVRTVDEQEIVAEIRPAGATRWAIAARRRVRCDHAIALAEP